MNADNPYTEELPEITILVNGISYTIRNTSRTEKGTHIKYHGFLDKLVDNTTHFAIHRNGNYVDGIFTPNPGKRWVAEFPGAIGVQNQDIIDAYGHAIDEYTNNTDPDQTESI